MHKLHSGPTNSTFPEWAWTLPPLTLSEIWKQGSLERKSWRKLCSGGERGETVDWGYHPHPTRWEQHSKFQSPSPHWTHFLTFLTWAPPPLPTTNLPNRSHLRRAGRDRDMGRLRSHLSHQFTRGPHSPPCASPQEDSPRRCRKAWSSWCLRRWEDSSTSPWGLQPLSFTWVPAPGTVAGSWASLISWGVGGGWGGVGKGDL